MSADPSIFKAITPLSVLKEKQKIKKNRKIKEKEKISGSETKKRDINIVIVEMKREKELIQILFHHRCIRNVLKNHDS